MKISKITIVTGIVSLGVGLGKVFWRPLCNWVEADKQRFLRDEYGKPSVPKRKTLKSRVTTAD